MQADDSGSSDQNDHRSQALSAFDRGENLSWDQLQIVATETGISPQQIREMKIKEQTQQLITKYKLPLEVYGFSRGMNPDEEFRLSAKRKPGVGEILFNTDFWSSKGSTYENESFITYLLFRAQAYYFYLNHYDAEHGAWIVEEESPSMAILRTAVDGSSTQWVIDSGPPTGRDLEFRRSLEPSGNEAKALYKLIEFAFRSIAQKAADDWAQDQYEKKIGHLPPQIVDKIRRRERSLAADFGRARSAMTRSERFAFQKLLKSPIRYTRIKGQPASEPTYDPPVAAPN